MVSWAQVKLVSLLTNVEYQSAATQGQKTVTKILVIFRLQKTPVHHFHYI